MDHKLRVGIGVEQVEPQHVVHLVALVDGVEDVVSQYGLLRESTRLEQLYFNSILFNDVGILLVQVDGAVALPLVRPQKVQLQTVCKIVVDLEKRIESRMALKGEREC